MKKTVAIVLAVSVLFFPATQTSAHVLLTDQSGEQGAILHVMPDDDPIAGQKSVLYLDLQNKIVEGSDVQAELTIKNSTGEENVTVAEIKGSLVMAGYTFPAQGVYELSYKISSQGEKYLFRETLRVSRGAASGVMVQPRHMWVEAVAVISGTGLALLLIVAFNRRREIASQSKM